MRQDSVATCCGQEMGNVWAERETKGARRGEGGKEEDLRSLLAAKERDLILAAELGKALLEKNEDLNKQNEKIAEECSQKLEVGIMAICQISRVL